MFVKVECLLGNVVNAVVSQAMVLLRDRGLQLIRDIPEEVKTLVVFGDQNRIQQVLANFLVNMVRYAPAADGWVEIQIQPTMRRTAKTKLVHLEVRCIQTIS